MKKSDLLAILKRREAMWEGTAEAMLSQRPHLTDEQFIRLLPAIHENMIRLDECRQLKIELK